MAITLAQAALNADSDIDKKVIDETIKSSYLLSRMTFDDAVSPGGEGATLTYGYTRLVNQRAAAPRAIGDDYVDAEATKERHTVDLRPFGGSFKIDRVLNAVARGAETAFQVEQLLRATTAEFNNLAINGDTAVDASAFDGLDKGLAGSATEMGADSTTPSLDLTNIATREDAIAALEILDEMLSKTNGKPDALLMNSRTILRVKSLARWAGYLTASEDAFGRKVEQYDGIDLIDLGEVSGSSDPVIPIEARDLDDAGANPAISGLTDIYAVRFDLREGFHAVSLAGQAPVRTWLPDFTDVAAQQRGAVEMVAAVALKATKGAAVLRNVKVQ